MILREAELKNENMKPLRNASTLILVAKNKLTKNPKTKANDINVFALRRSLTASHFPDSYVFPGGNCDPADEIPDWMELFPKSELNVPLSLSNNEFDSTNSNVIPQAISSRITAIRETFEESGILLCKKNTDPESFFATNYKIENETDWRKRISKNPIEFYNFCRKYECFPNLSCLHFLSNWITPYIFPKRFDGKFFIAALDHEVKGEPDQTEIQEVKWESVNYFLKNESIFLPPPQVYELNRLNSFENFQSLCDFIKNLDHLTCHPYIPVSLNATDGYILILPGDELYEKYSAFPLDHTIDVDCDIASFRGNVMNRVEYKDVDKKNFRATRGEVVTRNVKFYEDSSCSINRSKI